MDLKVKNKKWPVWWVLVAGGLLSAFATYESLRDVKQEASERFSLICDHSVAKINERLDAYELLLKGAAALFSVSDDVSRSQWRAYVDALRADESIVGIQGVGYAQIIPENQMAAHVARVRAEGYPQYSLFPEGSRDLYSSIVYLEPFNERNQRAFGYDMLSSPVRREAMERARDTGDVALSGKVRLKQETDIDTQPGILMYMPIYRHALPLETIEQRRAALQGWVYSAYRMNDFITLNLQNWAPGHSHDLDLKIFDETGKAENGLFDSNKAAKAGYSPLYQQRTLAFNGHKWQLDFDDPLNDINYYPVWFTLFSGLSLTGLLFLLLNAWVNTRFRAQEIAEKLTATIRESELLLQESEYRWKFALEGANAGVWDWNIQQGTVFYSKVWKSMLGYAEPELSNNLDEWRNRIHPDDLLKVLEGVQDYFEGRTLIYTLEFRMRCKNGSYKWILTRGVLVSHTADGQPLRMIGTHDNISQHKFREAELAQSNQRLETVLRAIPDLMFELDSDGRYLNVWGGDEALLFLPVSQLIGRTVHEVLPQVQAQQILAALAEAQAHGVSYGHEITLEQSTTHYFELSVAKLAEEASLSRFIVLSRDITARKLLEQKVNAAYEAKTAFLSNMSHELRTPMNGVVGMLDVLEQTKLDVSQHRMLTVIKQSSLALLHILNDVLDHSKIEANMLTVETIPTSLREVIEGAAQLMFTAAEEKSIRFTTFISPELPDAIVCDPHRLRQVLLNLMSNSIKFTARQGRRSGRVIVRAERGVDEKGVAVLHLTVKDNGIGIAPVQIEHLFEPFTQADVSTSRKYGGTGLGLSICQNLLNLMGGKITVKSELGAGALFTIELPLQTAKVGAEPALRIDGVQVLAVIKDLGAVELVPAYCKAAGATVTIVPDLDALKTRLLEHSQGRTVVVLGFSAGKSLPLLPAKVGLVRLVQRSESQALGNEVTVLSRPLFYHDLILGIATACGDVLSRENSFNQRVRHIDMDGIALKTDINAG